MKLINTTVEKIVNGENVDVLMEEVRTSSTSYFYSHLSRFELLCTSRSRNTNATKLTAAIIEYYLRVLSDELYGSGASDKLVEIHNWFEKIGLYKDELSILLEVGTIDYQQVYKRDDFVRSLSAAINDKKGEEFERCLIEFNRIKK